MAARTAVGAAVHIVARMAVVAHTPGYIQLVDDSPLPSALVPMSEISSPHSADCRIHHPETFAEGSEAREKAISIETELDLSSVSGTSQAHPYYQLH